jgi:hypothetical protein
MSDAPDFGAGEGLDFSAEIAETAPETGESSEQVNWEERYRSEVQDRIRERERYKPIRQVFDRMHPDDANAVQQFASAWAAGDQEAAIQWMVDNARTLAGDNFNRYISPQQQAAQNAVASNAVAQGQAAGMTPEQIQGLVQQQIAQYQEQQDIARYQGEIEQTIRGLGLEPETPLAHALILNATKRDDLDITAAWQEMEGEILREAQAIVERRRGAAASMPTASPNGMSSVVTPGSSPRDRAMARLQQQGL